MLNKGRNLSAVPPFLPSGNTTASFIILNADDTWFPTSSLVQSIYLSETRLQSYLLCVLPETVFQPVNSPLCQVPRHTPLFLRLFRIVLMIVFYAEFVKLISAFVKTILLSGNHSSNWISS